MRNKTPITWLKKELRELKSNYRGGGEQRVIDVCVQYGYDKKACQEVIMDSLWYSYEDFCRIHSKRMY